MLVKLTRFYHDSDVTLGNICIDGIKHRALFTLELPWNNNLSDISCIPEGKYVLAPYSSVKHPNVYEIVDVPNREKILIHRGNYTNEIKGCVLIGHGIETNGFSGHKNMVTNSGIANNYLKTLLKNDKHEIVISSLR